MGQTPHLMQVDGIFFEDCIAHHGKNARFPSDFKR